MLISFTRTVFFYFVLLLVIRLMGKRQIGQMEPSEFVVTMLVANLAAIPTENLDMPISTGLVPMAVTVTVKVSSLSSTIQSVRADFPRVS